MTYVFVIFFLVLVIVSETSSKPTKGNNDTEMSNYGIDSSFLSSRGFRNNNPLNIKQFNNDWLGEIGDDGTFVKFSSLPYGYRAAMKLMSNYKRKYAVDTFRTLIYRWSATDKETYLSFVVSRVSERTGINYVPDDYIDLDDPDYLYYLLEAMTELENGATGFLMPVDLFEESYSMLS